MVNVKETNLEFRSLTERETTDLLVIHHIGDPDRDVSAKEVHQWHLEKGWAGIGYQYLIRQNGVIERGRPRDMIGAHAEGFNWRSIGINLAGNFEKSAPTPAQVESASQLIAELSNIYNLTPTAETVVGHRDLMSTDCPGQNLYDILQTVRGKAIYYQQKWAKEGE